MVTDRGLVGVGLLRVHAVVFLDVGEGLVHQTTVAALVALRSGAIHQVLLAQGHQLARLPEVLTLQRAGGAEGPAGAALTLRETHTDAPGEDQDVCLQLKPLLVSRRCR